MFSRSFVLALIVLSVFAGIASTIQDVNRPLADMIGFIGGFGGFFVVMIIGAILSVRDGGK